MPADPPRSAPLVWVLTGDKAGDADQVRTLATALGWPFQEKSLVFNERYLRNNRLLGASLSSLEIARSAPIEPPWPDLVIAVGRRSVPVTQWIARQRPGLRLVHFGRPRAPLRWFDLVVTTPQYRLPPRRNVIRLAAPLSRFLLGRPEPIPVPGVARPLLGVLVGGPTHQFGFTPDEAERLADWASRLAQRAGGTAVFLSSRRSPEPIRSALAKRMPEAPLGYAELIGTADAFVVSADSASMIGDAGATERPVYLFELTPRKRARLDNAVIRLLTAEGLYLPPRDMSDLHGPLLAAGSLRRLSAETAWEPVTAPMRLHDGLTAVVDRVRRLFGSSE